MLLPIDELNQIVALAKSDDLMVSATVSLVEEYLSTEYDNRYCSTVDGWLDVDPDEAVRHNAIYADVGGENFADRIKRYAADRDSFAAKVAILFETDGHRCRSEGTLAAGAELNGAGLRVAKTWKTKQDQVVRDAHERLHDVTIPYSEQFEIDGFLADGPGLFGVADLDCNCRCELEIHVIE